MTLLAQLQLERADFVHPVNGKLEQLGHGRIVGREKEMLRMSDLNDHRDTVIKLRSQLLHSRDASMRVGQLMLAILNHNHVASDLLGQQLRLIFGLVQVLDPRCLLVVILPC